MTTEDKRDKLFGLIPLGFRQNGRAPRGEALREAFQDKELREQVLSAMRESRDAEIKHNSRTLVVKRTHR